MTTLDETSKALLRERRFGVLATINADGTPQQSTVWYELQGERIMMNTRVGRVKERNMKRDPRVSLCIEDGYRYLALKGTVELEYDHDRSQADIKALAVRYEGEEHAERRAKEVWSKQERVTLYMTIDKYFAYSE